MPKHNDLTGKIFGRLTVLGMAERTNRLRIKWRCSCECGKLTEVDTTNLTRTIHPTRSCGCYREEYSRNQPKGEISSTWKGGRRIEDGYVLIYKRDHPRAKSNGYIREHTLIMEEKIGRYLVKGENVHHINGDRTDNRPENLEIWNTNQPSGQRIEDKLNWAKEIIKLYG